MAMHVTQEVTLSKGNEYLKILLFSIDTTTLICVLSGKPTSDAISPSWTSHCHLLFDQSWLHNGCLHFLVAIVALKVQEGYSVVGNYARLPGYPAEMDARTVEEQRSQQHKSLPRSPPSQGSIWSQNGDDSAASLNENDLYRRERKGGTSILQLARYFYFPINEAAKRLDICPTVLKKICRRHGLRRWPHRKLQSIERSLRKLCALQAATSKDNNCHHLKALRAKIRELQLEKEALCFSHEVELK